VSAPRVVEAAFIKSAQSIADSLPEDMSEVVFLGRSNVGKSSTLNSLTQRKNLAKSSATPGKTQLINFFETRYLYNDESYPVRFVDLPGFGYAKVSKSLKEVWQKNLVEFIEHRVSIRLFILYVSNLKKNGHDRVHYEILQTIFGVDDVKHSPDEEKTV